jgi:GNAT superfamily N-acetyltransferase
MSENSVRSMAVDGVRLMAADDVSAVAGLRRAWTEEQVGRPIEDDAFEAAFAEWVRREADQRMTWVAVAEMTVVGMLNLLVFTRMPRPRDDGFHGPPRQWGYVANVFVLATHRNRGLGAELMTAATRFADGSEFARLVLSPSERSRRFYERAGFRPATDLLLRPCP